MQIAVCDDEKETRDMLAEKIGRFYPKAEVILYQSGKELLLCDTQPDILFLDIQMPGMDGMKQPENYAGRAGRLLSFL